MWGTAFFFHRGPTSSHPQLPLQVLRFLKRPSPGRVKVQLLFHIINNSKINQLGYVYMISHVHRIFLLLQHTKMWLFIQHESPQQELLLKLLENLYRKLLKIAHIYIRNCSSKFINSSTCSSNYLKWNFSCFYSTLSFVKKIYRISVVEAALRLPPT